MLDEWVAIASHRQGRTYLPPADECPLCPSTADRHTEIPAARLRRRRLREPVPVVRRRTPTPRLDRRPELFAAARARPVRGRLLHQRPRHRVRASCRRTRVRTVVEAWVDRTGRAVRAARASSRCSASRTAGEEIGVTLHHPHGQIYGYPFVTPRTAAACSSAARPLPRPHRAATCSPTCSPRELAEDCAGRDERGALDGLRAVRRPLAGRGAPVPATAGARPAGAGRRRARRASRDVYLDVLRAMDGLYDATAAVHRGVAPGAGARRPGPRLAAPRGASRCSGRPNKLKYLAGSESGMGAFVNDVAARADRGHRCATSLPR